jgi:hypothetical protein
MRGSGRQSAVIGQSVVEITEKVDIGHDTHKTPVVDNWKGSYLGLDENPDHRMRGSGRQSAVIGQSVVEITEKVDIGHDTHKTPVVDNWKGSYLGLDENPDHRFQRGVGRNHRRLTRHELRNRRLFEYAFIRLPINSGEQGRRRSLYIAVTYDPYEPGVSVDDREVAHAVRQEQLQHLTKCLRGGERLDRPVHDLCDLHGFRVYSKPATLLSSC